MQTTEGGRHPNRLAQLLKRRDESRKQIAARLGVSTSTVYRWETGRTVIPDRDKLRLARLLGVTRAHLMGWDTEDNPVTVTYSSAAGAATNSPTYAEQR